jgi:hypothetical protein
MACEFGFWDMLEALPPEARERVLREQAALIEKSLSCDAPDDTLPVATDAADEPKP